MYPLALGLKKVSLKVFFVRYSKTVDGVGKISKTRSMSSLTLFFVFVLAILGLLHFYLRFRITLLICTIVHWDFEWGCISQVGKN